MGWKTLARCSALLAIAFLAGASLSAQPPTDRFGVWRARLDAPLPVFNVMIYEPWEDAGMKITVVSMNREGTQSAWSYTTRLDGVFRPVTGRDSAETAVEIVEPRTTRILNRRGGEVRQTILNTISEDGDTIYNEYRRLQPDGSETVSHVIYERIAPVRYGAEESAERAAIYRAALAESGVLREGTALALGAYYATVFGRDASSTYPEVSQSLREAWARGVAPPTLTYLAEAGLAPDVRLVFPERWHPMAPTIPSERERFRREYPGVVNSVRLSGIAFSADREEALLVVTSSVGMCFGGLYYAQRASDGHWEVTAPTWMTVC